MPDFYDRLERYAETVSAVERAAIEAEMWEKFGVEEAVFVLDLSGFSRTAGKHGIIHCMAMIQRMRGAMAPLVEQFGGKVVKFEADNCFARFSEPASAVAAATECNRRFSELNAKAEGDFEIHACIGIDFGRFLLVEGVDFFGMPVNIASKLGEDIAEPGEILVTHRVMDSIAENAEVTFEPRMYTISGFSIDARLILY